MSWEVLRSQHLLDCRVFKIRRDLSRDLNHGLEHDFFVIESPDWINVIPVTTDGRIIMIEQYRHGINELTLEIPGGMVDEGELPVEAATRELLEETGFRTSAIELLARTRPNPAIQNNWLYSFIARDCIFEQPAQGDITEQINVRLVTPEEVPQLIAEGSINHSLVVTAFQYWQK